MAMPVDGQIQDFRVAGLVGRAKEKHTQREREGGRGGEGGRGVKEESLAASGGVAMREKMIGCGGEGLHWFYQRRERIGDN